MQRRTSRNLSRAVIVAVVLAVGATIWQSWTAGTPGMSGVVQTSWGPMSPADRDLLVKVRLAGLWEMPTGQQAQQQATSAAVRDVATKISAEHMVLDQDVRDTADKLGVLLPASPASQNVVWMNEISSKTGSDYDRTFVQRLRQAHGIVLPVIAEVRVGTRNELVRAFATRADEYVTRHINYLESTGLVDYPALPETPSPGLLSGSANWTDLLVPGLILIACLLVAVGLGATLRGRNGGRKGNAAVAPAVPARAHRIATARSLIALPEARTPRREVPREIPDDDTPTGSLPRINDSGGFASVGRTDTGRFSVSSAVGMTGGFSSSAGSTATATGGFPSTRTPGRGVPYPDGAPRAVTDTGPRHAVRR
jgi:predicted outer membrane protein